MESELKGMGFFALVPRPLFRKWVLRCVDMEAYKVPVSAAEFY